MGYVVFQKDPRKIRGEGVGMVMKHKNSENAVVVQDLSKTFRLPHDDHSGLKQLLIGMLRRKRKKGYETQEVLKNVSFEVKKGDFFGIVGRNGSGKSTLLKLLAGIYVPDSGVVQTNGSIVPFIELGVGFNPELSGRENVFLNGALLGFSHKEMESMYDDIVEFAEIERFMDQKLKNYSSGMQVRLAFSIAIKAQGDILILDEVLAVGDEAFQRKCNNYFAKIRKDKAKTVILVTHSMDNVRKYCNKAMMLHEGKIVFSGSPEDVANEYSIENLNTAQPADNKTKNKGEKTSLIKGLRVDLSPEKCISQDSILEIKISYRVPTKIPTRVKASLYDINRNVPLFAANSSVINKDKVSIILRTKVGSLNDTNIRVQVSIRNEKYDVLDFLPDDMSPTISLRRTDYPSPTQKTTWAVLFNRGEWEEL